MRCLPGKGEAQPGPLAPGRYVRLSVADTGVGMDDETLKRAVEPLFSTKGIAKGTGSPRRAIQTDQG